MATAAIETRSTSRTFKFAIGRTVLLEALTRAAVALPKRGTMPILNAVLVRAGAGELSLMCSDLELGVSTRVTSVACSGTGEAALPAKRLMEIVGALPQSATIEVSIDGNRAKLVAGRAKFDVLGMPVEEWPRQNAPLPDGSATLSGKALVALLNRVGSHVASSEKAGALPAISGILLDVTDRGAFLVGTDRHRLIRIALPFQQSERPLLGQYSHPKSTAAAIAKLFADDESISIEGTRQQLTIVGSESTLTYRLISERYPEYSHFFKFPSRANVVLDRAEFAAAVKRVATASTEARLTMAFSESELALNAQSADAGRGEDVVPCAFKADETIPVPFKFDVNPRYILDGVESFASEQVRVDFAGGLNPLYIRDAKEGADSVNVSMTVPLHPDKGDKGEKSEKGKGGK